MPQDNLNWRGKLRNRIIERYGNIKAYTQGRGLPHGTNPVSSGTLSAILYASVTLLPDTARTLYQHTGLEELRYFFEVDRFPSDLKNWRARKGYASAAEAARVIGVNPSTYAEWESGNTKSPWQIKPRLREKGRATGLIWFADVENIGMEQHTTHPEQNVYTSTPPKTLPLYQRIENLIRDKNLSRTQLERTYNLPEDRIRGITRGKFDGIQRLRYPKDRVNVVKLLKDYQMATPEELALLGDVPPKIPRIEQRYTLTPENASLLLNSYLSSRASGEKQAQILRELGILKEDSGLHKPENRVDDFTEELRKLLSHVEYFRNEAPQTEISELRKRLGNAGTGSGLTSFLYELFQGGGLVR